MSNNSLLSTPEDVGYASTIADDLMPFRSDWPKVVVVFHLCRLTCLLVHISFLSCLIISFRELQMFKLSVKLFSVVLCIAVAGCGGPEGPVLVPVSGTVLLDGEPVSGALVRFVPASGPSSGGETNEKGEFTLIGPGNRPGTIVGTHTVTVGCPYNPGQGSSPDGNMEAPADAGGCKVPMKYSDVSSSDASAVVPAEGKSGLVIELTSK